MRLRVQISRNDIGDAVITEVLTSMDDMDNVAAKAAGSIRRWLRSLTWRDKPYHANFSITAQWLEGDERGIIDGTFWSDRMEGIRRSPLVGGHNGSR